jgi:alpha-L-fucosidase 2
VRVQLAGTEYLTLAEVRVLRATTSNLALNKAASQSSTGWDGAASRAVDGNTDGSFWDGSVTHTEYDANAWWQVDLGSVGSLSQVELFNRTDFGSERLSNFYVFVSDVPFTSTSLSATQAQAGVSSYHVAGPVGASTSLSINRSGRYVRIQLAGTDYLSLAEVKVMGA